MSIEQQEESAAREVAWPPLESNPEVFSHLLAALSENGSFQCYDLVSFTPEDLTYVPSNVIAVLMLFRITPEYTNSLSTLRETACPEDLYFMRQKVGNACGMVALLHALANCNCQMGKNSFMKTFLEETKSMNPEQRGLHMSRCQKLANIQNTACYMGQSRVVQAEEAMDTHFICFVKGSDEQLYELDGRKGHPVCYGPVGEGFFKSALRQCKLYPQICGDNMMCAAIAICSLE